jgi:predicted phosphoribosyltransferase/predicted alpha/beta-hydrolase family hydrolase
MPDVPIEVRVPVGGLELAGTLVPPRAGGGIVLFAHGSGSSRHSPRNRFVAQILQEAGLGTLLFDLLTAKEDGDRSLVFDVDLLARRLLGATAWVISRDSGVPAGTPVGYFGASTGAAAALEAAAELGGAVRAIVSRGGRPDLARPRLADVQSPTLLIVGGEDQAVLALNREAQALLVCETELVVIPGATHLFEEPGSLEQVAALAREWFVRHFEIAEGSMRFPLFADRRDAARMLADALADVSIQDGLVVGLARGGAVPAAVIAERLALDFDVLAVRKVGYPGQPEYAVGAVTPAGGVFIRDTSGLPVDAVAAVVTDAQSRAEELDAILHAEEPALDPAGKEVVLVDDGLATGATMRAAVRWAREAGATRVVVAVPIGPAETVAVLRAEADEVVCPVRPRVFGAVGLWYEGFEQVSDADVLALLRTLRRRADRSRRAPAAIGRKGP